MTNIISNIFIGFKFFPIVAVFFTLPILIIPVIRYKKINPVRIILNYVFLLYMLCLFSLVFLPLPEASQITKLDTYEIQLIPFSFISDIIRETPFVWNQPSTYIPSLFNNAVMQVVLNILMTIPFGIFLRYYYRCSTKRILLLTFALSLFIEIAQLTGLFFIYNGSYRLCDVDDLIVNTLGGYIGCQLVCRLQNIIPAIKAFDRSLLPNYKSRIA